MKSLIPILAELLLVAQFTFAQDNNKYLNQKPPGTKAEIFAPNIVSKQTEFQFGSVFNKDVTEFFYAANVKGKSEIRYCKLDGDAWSEPETIFVHEKYGYNDPFLSPDEQRLYFISKRAMDGKGDLKDYDIWYAEKTNNGWSEPINAGTNINTNRNEYYISFTNDGTMYFSSNKNAPDNRGNDFDVYSAKYKNGKFQKPERLNDSINTEYYEADVFIDPDESYIIFAASRPDGLGEGDLYISFKTPEGDWTKSKNMGNVINTTGHELCPYVSYDKKYFFYTSNGNIYWVSTKVFEDLK